MVSTWSTLLGLTYGFFLGGRSGVIVGTSFFGEKWCRCVVWFLIAGFILPQGMASNALKYFLYFCFFSPLEMGNDPIWLICLKPPPLRFSGISLFFQGLFESVCLFGSLWIFWHISTTLVNIGQPNHFTKGDDLHSRTTDNRMTFLFHYVLLTLLTSSDMWNISDILWLVKIVTLSSDQRGTDEFESKVCELFGSSARVFKGDCIFFDVLLWEETGTGSGTFLGFA